MSGADRGPVGHALELALAEIGTVAQDGATVALARRYARDIDDAAVVSLQAGQLVRDLEQYPDLDDATLNRARALTARIEETAVLGLLGPKLQVTLTELGMTPRARSEIAGKGGRSDGPPTDNPAARRRAARSARLHTA